MRLMKEAPQQSRFYGAFGAVPRRREERRSCGDRQVSLLRGFRSRSELFLAETPLRHFSSVSLLRGFRSRSETATGATATT